MPSQRSLLLTGATGFVGGTVLSQLLNSPSKILDGISLTAVVRKQGQAEILKEKGVEAVVVPGGLDDSEALADLASRSDIVINAAIGYHTGSAKALVTGLGWRKDTGEAPIYLQLSGTTNLGVGDITGAGGECRVFSDNDDGIYEYEVARQKEEPYSQRATDLTVIETGEKLGVRTYILMPPLIYGRGTGFFNRTSIQIPTLVRHAISSGRAEYISPGTSAIGHVHVEDLAAQFEAVLARALADTGLPGGRRGFFFSNTGEHTWVKVAGSIAKTGYELGALGSAEAVGVGLGDVAAKLFNGDVVLTEAIFASSSRTRAERGYEIGWRPSKTEEDWKAWAAKEFRDIYGKAT